MMSLSCVELGMPDCPFVAEGADRYNVEGKLLHHGVSVHGDKMQDMSPAQWEGMMRMMDRELVA